MEENYELISIHVNKNETNRLIASIEEICDRFNLYNYFGIFSISADEILKQNILEDSENDASIRFVFEQFVGGILFRAEGSEGNSFEITQILDLLSDEIVVSDDGESIELYFFINGIDEIELKMRKSIISKFIEEKQLDSKKISHGG